MFHAPELRRGDVQVGGSGSFSGSAGPRRDRQRARDGRRVSRLDHAAPQRPLRRRGDRRVQRHRRHGRAASLLPTHSSRGQAPAEGRIAEIALRKKLLDIRGIAMSVLGGSFHGEARLRDWRPTPSTGDIAGFDARRVVALYSPEPLPWDGLGAGPVAAARLFASASPSSGCRPNLAVTPAAEGAPVHGQITANYDASTEILDLGRSTLTLPSSRADFSGAFGRELRAHLETHRPRTTCCRCSGRTPTSFPSNSRAAARCSMGP